MASLNGIEIKNLKTFRGHEGEPLYQGSIYLDGKRLGYWSQDSWGASDNYDFNTTILQPIVNKVVMTNLVAREFKEYFTVDGLIDIVLKLKNDEKVYKDNCKKGYTCTLLVTDGYHCFYTATRSKEATADKEYALRYFSDEIALCKAKCYKNHRVEVKVYNRPDDFILNF